MNNPALDLLKQHGFFGLAGYDGCACGRCEVHHIQMEVSCRKSSGNNIPGFNGNLVRVYDETLDHDPKVLSECAKFIVDDLIESTGNDTRVRFCSYERDKNQQCVYCQKPRKDTESYLCEECKIKSDPFGYSVAERFSYPNLDAKIND